MGNSGRLDKIIAAGLSRHSRFVSRRAFLSRLARGVMAIAGVSVAATVGLYEVPSANAFEPPPAWEQCGLHGYYCSPTCGGGTSNPGHGWVKCCENPKTQQWYCCTYSDQCSTAEPPATRPGCSGTTPCGPMWCAQPAPGQPPVYYICTNISCGSTGYASDADCTAGCNSTQYEGDDCNKEGC